MARDYRSASAAEYRKLYNTARWKRERLAGLREEPICRMCKATGRITPATVRDHIKAHKGDPILFWDRSNHQSLCAPHHDETKQRDEVRGYVSGCDATGRPTDPNHAWNKVRA